MTESNLEEAFLELTTRSIKFGPASTANAVFYDEGRREILSVDSNGTITGIEIIYVSSKMYLNSSYIA